MEKCSFMNARNVESLLSNITSRFITDDEESTEQPSSVRQVSGSQTGLREQNAELWHSFNSTPA